MKKLLLKTSNNSLRYSFYLLFFLVPLILTPYNYELFEYNKMMLVYGLTVIIIGCWIIKMIIEGQIQIAKTPLDLPIILFLGSQIVSTMFSLDRHVSIWGYYSRFNGGLLSTISYILLYYAFVSNFQKEKIKRLIYTILISGLVVATYGILEHFGIDKELWVQDVQNRVFSTLGQPNWLAAYLAILIPITIGLTISKIKYQISNTHIKNQKYNSKIINIGLLGFLAIGSIFYICLLFTKSRSGFLGLWLPLVILWLIFLYFTSFPSKNITPLIHAATEKRGLWLKHLSFFILTFVLITFFLGAPFQQINRFTLKELTKSKSQTPISAETKPIGASIIGVGITESGIIRRIVWKGAIDIFRRFPLFGTGVETFAFAYYKYRPVEHNMTSEWDFLYNKAHNEYLNYAATTGSFGLGSYLLLIFLFILWSIKRIIYYELSIKNKKNIPPICYLLLTTFLFTAWLSILVTNFFGFSVVIIQLFFFLIPAISFVLFEEVKPVFLFKGFHPSNNLTISYTQLPMITIVLFSIFYLLFSLSRLWYADTLFSTGYHLSKANDYLSAHDSIKQAIALNSNEPLYYDELAYPSAQLAVALKEENEATYSAYLEKEAILASKLAVTLSPNNVNFFKTRTRVFYTLAQLDEKYLNDAFTALIQAKTLSPTDPKISYNLALLYDKLGQSQEAIAELSETTKLKPDYRDAYFALGLFFQRENKKEKAKEAFNFILKRIATDDAEAKKMLEELK